MGLKPRFIKVEDESVGRYDVEDDFIDSLSELDDILLKIKISDYIDNNLPEYPDNKFTTYVVGGFVMHNDESIYFAIEILKTTGSLLTLTDFQLIDVNEYLDLINLNLYIK
jgi:hypothetical protein